MRKNIDLTMFGYIAGIELARKRVLLYAITFTILLSISIGDIRNHDIDKVNPLFLQTKIISVMREMGLKIDDEQFAQVSEFIRLISQNYENILSNDHKYKVIKYMTNEPGIGPDGIGYIYFTENGVELVEYDFFSKVGNNGLRMPRLTKKFSNEHDLSDYFEDISFKLEQLNFSYGDLLVKESTLPEVLKSKMGKYPASILDDNNFRISLKKEAAIYNRSDVTVSKETKPNLLGTPTDSSVTRSFLIEEETTYAIAVEIKMQDGTFVHLTNFTLEDIQEELPKIELDAVKSYEDMYNLIKRYLNGEFTAVEF